MNSSSIEEEIRKNGRFVYSNRGTSMLPLIREGKDVVVLTPPSFPLRKYDVPLYKPAHFDGKYVLHRIVKVVDGSYVIRGDNCITCEYGVSDGDIVGVLSAVVRGGKEISVSSMGYKIYSRIWCFIYPLRYVFKRFKGLLRRIFR